MNSIFACIVFLSLIVAVTCQVICPSPSLTAPCLCEDGIFTCSGSEKIDLTQLFSKMSKTLDEKEKRQGRLIINNTGITELVENQFSDILFADIVINSTNIEKIEKNAFGVNNNYTQHINIYNNSELSGDSVFEALNQLSKASVIELQYNPKITKIPAKAFTLKQEHLFTLVLMYNSFKSIGSYAFEGLTNISTIVLEDGTINHLDDYAFAINRNESAKLNLILYNNKLTADSFSPNSLNGIKGVTTLVLAGNQITWIDKDVFLEFLNGPGNSIPFDSELDCTNCKTAWLRFTKDTSLRKFSSLKCSSHKNFDDPDSFANCRG